MRFADVIKEDDGIDIYNQHNNKGAMYEIYDTCNKRTLWYHTFKSRMFSLWDIFSFWFNAQRLGYG